jgi:hypothetical protein
MTHENGVVGDGFELRYVKAVSVMLSGVVVCRRRPTMVAIGY